MSRARPHRQTDLLGATCRAVHESAVVQVFGCRHDEAIHELWRPASEKRQGTKSREVGHRRWRGRRSAAGTWFEGPGIFLRGELPPREAQPLGYGPRIADWGKKSALGM